MCKITICKWNCVMPVENIEIKAVTIYFEQLDVKTA